MKFSRFVVKKSNWVENTICSNGLSNIRFEYGIEKAKIIIFSKKKPKVKLSAPFVKVLVVIIVLSLQRDKEV